MKRQQASKGPRQIKRAAIAGFTLTEGVHAAGSVFPGTPMTGPRSASCSTAHLRRNRPEGRCLCTPSTLKVMPAGEPHCDRFDHGDAHGLLIETDPGRADAMRPWSPLLQERVTFDGGPLAALGRRIYREFSRMDTAAPLAIEGLMLELLARGTRERADAGVGAGPPGSVRAREILHDDPTAHDGLGALARGRRPPGDAGRVSGGRTVAASASICAICELWGRAPAARLGYAARDDRHAAGFADQSHFSNVFKRQTGFSPSAFRRWVRAR